MKPYLELEIPTEGALQFDLKKEFLKFPLNMHNQMWLEGCGGVWQVPASELFDTDWLNMFEEKTRLKVDAGLVFYRAGGYQHAGAHIDVEPLHGKTLPVSGSFNWVLDRDYQSQMTWYEPWWNADSQNDIEAAAQGKFPHPSVTDNSSEEHRSMLYQETPIELLKETHAHSLAHDRLTLVRTSIPHSVRMGPRPRWSVTVRSWGSLPWSWAECVERFL